MFPKLPLQKYKCWWGLFIPICKAMQVLGSQQLQQCHSSAIWTHSACEPALPTLPSACMHMTDCAKYQETTQIYSLQPFHYSARWEENSGPAMGWTTGPAPPALTNQYHLPVWH